ncbi:MAG: GNAT family N-acetyltransferase [Methanocalculus sp. MSAO_Arc1]|uniref:GNAT family N-acetyltransferase n=1 Tax=Methanocalculus TaxID=71151 RepID=UPI000FF6E8DA|nr:MULTISPECIES: GNAT family N-acetyltransferase [unclassified Methanocalculus]MCP1662470.1 GNAT superfamily N-acetyltransferase [Methanocalculus sp. AMF5]RQD80813.1 MAG: GNAT family N-acetyltransferase [Methanocalculus sp. MSAO_Arc1]
MTGEHNPIANGIAIDRFLVHDFDSFVPFYIDIFYDREPLGQCIGLSREQMDFITRTLYGRGSNFLSQRLSWIARDCSQENRPVGIIACDDPVATGELQMSEDLNSQDLERISVAMALLEEISRPMQEIFAQGEGVCMHVAAVGVAPEYQGAGIATRLLQTALSEAKKRGFRVAVAECTSPGSRMLFEKAGFARIHALSVSEFEIQGRRPLPDCNLEIHLMQKILDE